MQTNDNNKKIYDPKDIENKWIEKWEQDKVYKTSDLKDLDKTKKKMHVLDMFPYPSGEGLHTGHTKIFGASDAYARMKRMQGYNVLHATGWDAYGLPAEQFALKNKVNPKISTKKNTDNFERQMKMLGFSYDWDRTVNTTDPKFYKWTQWIFKQLYKKGLCYESFEPINWCPSCKTGLANEDLENGLCERCGSVVEKKPIRQWVIRITDYAEKLLQGVDGLDWKESIKEMQRNWIGKSEGAEIDFEIIAGEEKNKFTIFTTRPDTLFGCTYCVFAPEHKLVQEYLDKNLISNKAEAEKYIVEAKNKSEIERSAEGKEKTGVKLEGVFAINPANQKQVPVYIADYVMANYGTGAIMAVPAHDERDYEFAKKYNIEILPVVLKDTDFAYSFVMGTDKITEADFGKMGVKIVEKTKDGFYKIFIPFNKIEEYKSFVREKMTNGFWNEFSTKENFYFIFKHKDGRLEEFELNKSTNDQIDTYGMTFNDEQPKKQLENVYSWLAKNSFYKEILMSTENGRLINSEKFDGTDSEEAKEKITEFVGGKMVKKYRLRDWVFARQRYWGEPFPIVFDENHKSYLVADSELPVVLPDVESYEPTGNGEGPLKNIKDWVEVKGEINSEGEFVSNQNGKTFFRESNTMPQWAGSSWYWLRYLDPQNENFLVGENEEKYWSSNGYSVDMYLGGLEHATRHLIYGRFWNLFLHDIGVLTHVEPFKRLEAVGLVLGEGGVKMSKRLGNVVNPDDMVAQFGADTLRLYIAFAASYHDSFSWDTKAIVGPRRFIERVWNLQYKLNATKDLGGENEPPRSLAASEVETLLHQTIKKVSEDYEKLQFNTAVAQMMIYINAVEKVGEMSADDYKIFLKLLAPLCPFVTEEIWSNFGEQGSIHLSSWPTYDPNKIVNKIVNIAIQINGKLRDVFVTETDMIDDEVIKLAKQTEGYKKWIGDNIPKKVIVVKNKIVNIII